MKQALKKTLIGSAFFLSAAVTQTGSAAVSPEQAKAFAKEAYIFTYPLVMNYRTLYAQAIEGDKELGKWVHLGLSSPKDTDIVTPNNDTPYSYAWVDLRAEPWVLTMPAIEKERFYTSQWDDLWGYVLDNPGSVNDGNGEKHILRASPSWKGELPEGIVRVIRGESDLLGTLTRTQVLGETIETRIGKLEFTHDFANGYPTDESVEKLYDEIDFQRASQAYLWSLPIVSFAEWQKAHEETFGAKSGDVVVYDNYLAKLGILTANATTPYIISFFNLDETGPMVVEMPAGAVAGFADDMWQRPLIDMGQTGPDKGQGGTYVILGPGQQADRSSRMDLQVNGDGSVDLYVGPKPPGKERNWVETVPGRAWFSYFRLHGPKQAHFDGAWVLPDFEPIE